MPFRPTPIHRRNPRGVLFPLTEAIRRTYGTRTRDNAYPLGAFYTQNISPTGWRHIDGIWYTPLDPVSVSGRNSREEVVIAFIDSISTGQEVELPSGILVNWERIPESESSQLPTRVG